MCDKCAEIVALVIAQERLRTENAELRAALVDLLNVVTNLSYVDDITHGPGLVAVERAYGTTALSNKEAK